MQLQFEIQSIESTGILVKSTIPRIIAKIYPAKRAIRTGSMDISICPTFSKKILPKTAAAKVNKATSQQPFTPIISTIPADKAAP